MLLPIHSMRPLLPRQQAQVPPRLAATAAILPAILTKLLPKTIICRYASSGFPSTFSTRGRQHRHRAARAPTRALCPEKPTPPEELISLDGPFPFHIQRSSNGNIPVYNMKRKTATFTRTCIRNVTGDLNALGRIIQQRLNLPTMDIIIKCRSDKVFVRGLMRERVRDLLKKMGV